MDFLAVLARANSSCFVDYFGGSISKQQCMKFVRYAEDLVELQQGIECSFVVCVIWSVMYFFVSSYKLTAQGTK